MSASDPGQMPQNRHDTHAGYRVRASADAVPGLRSAVLAAARRMGIDEGTCKRVALAVSEAATNAVLHAFRERRGHITAKLEEHDGELLLTVADDGIGLTMRADSPGLGMGLGIIAEVTDSLEIATKPGQGTELRMGFRPRHP